MGDVEIHTVVNGSPWILPVAPDAFAADVLRDACGASSVKVSCRALVCGACTVIVDGRAMSSCRLPAPELDGREVRTLEGLEGDPRLTSLREAFVVEDAVQCGFCIPGQLVGARAALDRGSGRAADVLAALDGHYCRCGGYDGIRRAVLRALDQGRCVDPPTER